MIRWRRNSVFFLLYFGQCCCFSLRLRCVRFNTLDECCTHASCVVRAFLMRAVWYTFFFLSYVINIHRKRKLHREQWEIFYFHFSVRYRRTAKKESVKANFWIMSSVAHGTKEVEELALGFARCWRRSACIRSSNRAISSHILQPDSSLACNANSRTIYRTWCGAVENWN